MIPQVWNFRGKSLPFRIRCDSAAMDPLDPWKQTLQLLSQRPPRFVVAPLEQGARWAPVATRNPRDRSHATFSPIQAASFVRDCVQEFLAHRQRGARGSPPGLRCRDESWMRDPTQRVLVMVVDGTPDCPAVYVKWLVSESGFNEPIVFFVSFHASTR